MKRDLVGDTSAREGGALAATGLAVKSAALSHMTLVTVAFAVVTAILWQYAAIFWIVPVVFLALFGWRLGQVAPWNQARRRHEMPLALPDPTALTDGAAQSMVTRLWQARKSLRHALAESPTGAAYDLSKALRGVRDLERRALVLVARVEYISKFLSAASLSRLEIELGRLQSHERKAKSGGARACYQRAAGRCAAHIGAVRGLEAQREQLLGTIDYMLGTLEAVPAKVTRIQLARIEAAEGGADPVDPAAEAARLFEDLDAVEEAFAPLVADVAQRPAPAPLQMTGA